MQAAIPPEFREKAYFKDKSFEEVIKEHVNLQTLLGKRPDGIPKPDASAEEWTAFLTTLRPESAEAYELPETEFSKTHGRDDEYVKNARDILFNANVNPHQAKAIMEGFEKYMGNATATKESAKAEMDKAREVEFETLLDTTYKGDKQNVIDRTKRLMAEAVAPDMKEKVNAALKEVSNETLFALTAVMEGIHKKYIAEDAPPGGGDGSAGEDAASLQEEAEGIMKTPAYNDFRNSGHDSARQRVRDLFDRIAKMKK